MGVFIQILYFKMWLWISIGLSIITKVHGYAGGAPLQSCESMSPVHERESLTMTQKTDPPFEVSYNQGNVGEPVTVFLRSKSHIQFRGFMLEAREKDTVDKGRPVGKFIMLDSATTQFLTCSGLPNSAVTQVNNQRKINIRVNWTAQGEERDITFGATFVQDFDRFWEQVNVTLPRLTTTPPPSTQPSTTTSTEPSTTTSTTEPSTTTSTTKPSTTTSTTEPSTTTRTTQPSTTTSTTEPSTTTSTTTSTTQPSTTTSTTQPSTTTRTTEPSTTKTPPNPVECMRAAMVLLNFDNIFVAAKLGLPEILTITLTNSPFLHHRNKVVKISCCLLCAAVEIPSLILLCVGDSSKVTIALVCVVIAINFIELIIVSLSIGPSHELKEICDLIVTVCSVINMIFTTAAIFKGVLEIDNCSKKRRESWLLKVMFAYTAWNFLFVIWVFIFTTQIKAMLGRSTIGSSKNSESWRQQRKKKKLSAAEVNVTAVSVILIVGNMCFAAAVIAAIFVCQEK